jgi:putative ABC transport system substrate-binding protein
VRRREFITLLGGAAAWSFSARAQQPRVPIVGFLSVAAPTEGQEFATVAFHKGLSETGYVEGRNIAIEYRWVNNELDKLPELAADLVSRRVAVIFATGGAASANAAKAATTSIPIVFANGQDPVAMGLVVSFNRPGGNVTGVTFMASELGPKRLGLLKEVVPGAARYALLVDPNAPQTDSIVAELRAAAASVGRQIEVFDASSNRGIDAAFADLVVQGADALVVGSSALFTSRRVQLVTLAAIHRLPAIYYDRNSVQVGGLMSYGASIADAMRLGGIYVGRILKGEKPSDLPVTRAVKFELLLNLQTARSLGIEVPASLIATADEVIE